MTVAHQNEPDKTESSPNVNITDHMRMVANWLDAHPELSGIAAVEFRYGKVDCRRDFSMTPGQQTVLAAAFARAVGMTKKIHGETVTWLVGELNGLPIELTVDRAAVCRRIQKEVTLPAEPEQVIPAKPERTVTVDDWECGDSILASANAGAERAKGGGHV